MAVLALPSVEISLKKTFAAFVILSQLFAGIEEKWTIRDLYFHLELKGGFSDSFVQPVVGHIRKIEG